MSSIHRDRRVPVPGLRAAAAVAVLLAATLVAAVVPAVAQTTPAAGDPASAAPAVRVVNDAAGSRLQVGGQDFMVLGMNWDYFPIGQNYAWDLWSQPDDVIRTALSREMPLLKGMGVNTIRQYAGIPPRWVKYIYETYGIWTVINHTVGRYGFTLKGAWHPNVDYSDPAMRAALKTEVLALADQFRGTPGVLMFLLGNENNYGLVWKSAAVEALPKGERDVARARYLYSLFGEVIQGVHEHLPGVPVAMANGDAQYIDLIAQECKGLDVFGTNCYRGISARDLFQVVKDKLGVPMMFTEFGSDAYNAREMREDQAMQARYLIGQWKEIYEQSSGKGQVGNAIGGFIFQWSDGWWKFGLESRLDAHDTNASWPDGGYDDYVQGQNNMNEEWWGICAKGRPDSRGLFEEYPRAAYYALQRAFTLAAYAPGTDLAAIRAHFATIDPAVASLTARADHASLATSALEHVRLVGVRGQVETYQTGGEHLTTPRSASTTTGALPAYRGFDRLESFYADVQANPAPNVTGTVSVNVLGNVPRNSIDEIFYEKRGLTAGERVRIYRAGVNWDDRWFTLDGFYRTGHFHWGYEGDFFGLYREANYGPNIDIYNGDAPAGVEMAGKRQLSGLKAAFGPQLWWGANPSVMLKYGRQVGAITATGVFQDDITEQSSVNTSIAIPQPPTRKATLTLKGSRGPATLEVGGIWSGATKVGQRFQVFERRADGDHILEDRVRDEDAWGAKAKLTVERGAWHWYAQGASMGLVADAGPTAVQNFTGWNLKDTGSGNQVNFITGLAWSVGRFQVGPNFLWQRPIVAAMPLGLPLTGAGRLRNILLDPFAVHGNRKTVGAELMLTYDPTPGTWLWMWDNDVREDARLAGSLDLMVRHLPTNEDANIGILGDGTTRFAFPAGPGPVFWHPSAGEYGLWEINARVVSRVAADARVAAHAYVGNAQSNGDNPATHFGARLAKRHGADVRVTWRTNALAGFVKVNDWGPYDYHRDFNLTYPLQLVGDVSHTLGSPLWLDRQPTQTRIGARVAWRTLDQFSPRFVANPLGEKGKEWEVRTYLVVAI